MLLDGMNLANISRRPTGVGGGHTHRHKQITHTNTQTHTHTAILLTWCAVFPKNYLCIKYFYKKAIKEDDNIIYIMSHTQLLLIMLEQGNQLVSDLINHLTQK